MLYPVCCGISEGGNLIAPDSESIFYGILDCCLIPITCAVFLALHWRIDPVLLGLYMRTFNDPVGGYQQPVTASGGSPGVGKGDWVGPTSVMDVAREKPVIPPETSHRTHLRWRESHVMGESLI